MFVVPISRETRHLSRLFEHAFDRASAPATSSENGTSRSPALDVAETELAYTVKVEMPGVAKEDVKVSVAGRQVSVQAQSQRNEVKNDGERIVYRERAAASYARSFTLPLEVDQAESGAKLDQGVLTLTLPKRNVRGAAQVTVN